MGSTYSSTLSSHANPFLSHSAANTPPPSLLSVAAGWVGESGLKTVPGSTRHTASLTRTHEHPPIPCTHTYVRPSARAACALRVGLSPRRAARCLSVGQVVARAVSSLGGRNDRRCEQKEHRELPERRLRLPTGLTLGRSSERERGRTIKNSHVPIWRVINRSEKWEN